MSYPHTISSEKISAVIDMRGAELCSLKTVAGSEILWQAGPAWPRHAPHLFPIIGKLKNNEFRHKGHTYKMSQHGFARDSDFTWLEKYKDRCKLLLRDNDQTKAMYPFSFELEVAFTVDENRLLIRYIIRNTGEDILPASIGAHPAFLWPLTPGIKKDAYVLSFSHMLDRPIPRLVDGLLSLERYPSPVKGKTLNLNEKIFDTDAIIFDYLPAKNVLYSAADDRLGIEVSWDENFTALGLWSKPGSGFLCIEPWHGTASPEDFDGEITSKPGMKLIAPGMSMTASFNVQIMEYT